mmetsp:Transcript_77196/g.153077  ORF Transcript_77196/g.153077 Transcript_77196/m.153077 type:complete len:570 (+) Transcript_77196:46-1755(+)
MVVIEDVEEEVEASPEVTLAAAAAVVVSGAGREAANSLYRPTGYYWHGAPVFENDVGCLLSREPHPIRGSKQLRYGWIIGRHGRPLYAVKNDGMVPPTVGWQRFEGELPVPQLRCWETLQAASEAAGQAWKEQGNVFFKEKRYCEAEARWTRALAFVGPSEPIRITLHANRAQARIEQQRWAQALDDAQAVLQQEPVHQKALLRGAVAARELGQISLAREYLERCLAEHPSLAEAQRLLRQLSISVETSACTSSGASSFQKAAASQTACSKAEKPNNERVPLSQLPYNNMGLPKEQTELMDKFFRDTREQKDARHSATKATGGHIAASQKDPCIPLTEAAVAKSASSIPGKDQVIPSMESIMKKLDQEEAEEKRRGEAEDLAQLRRLASHRRGEPTRLEQAGTEIYAWWTLPRSISGKEIKVTASRGGGWLTVAVRDVLVFDQQLFSRILGDNIVWSVADGELHMTLTKSERNQLWEQLGQVPEVRRDAEGQACADSIPEPLSAGDRLEMFRQIVNGDDGEQVRYDELDANERELVDLMRRQKHALATSNAEELSRVEMELDEIGKFVV